MGFEVVQDKEVDDANLARAFMIDQGSKLRFAHMRRHNAPDEAMLDIIECATCPATGERSVADTVTSAVPASRSSRTTSRASTTA